MKAKKFLKKMRAICCEENCWEKCPASIPFKNKDGTVGSDCLLSEGIEHATDRQFDVMLEKVKKWEEEQ